MSKYTGTLLSEGTCTTCYNDHEAIDVLEHFVAYKL